MTFKDVNIGRNTVYTFGLHIGQKMAFQSLKTEENKNMLS